MSPKFAVYLIWAIWLLSWTGAVFWSAPAVKRAGFGGQLVYRLVTLAGIALLFGVWSPRMMAMTQLWHPSQRAMWIADLGIVLGFAFSWWARVHLGLLWSSGITAKQDHHLIATGPYALVRHPIYTGIIIASFATAAVFGTLVAFAGAAVMTYGWYLKARKEEVFLRENIGFDTYHEYAERTAMLIPFLRF